MQDFLQLNKLKCVITRCVIRSEKTFEKTILACKRCRTVPLPFSPDGRHVNPSSRSQGAQAGDDRVKLAEISMPVMLVGKIKEYLPRLLVEADVLPMLPRKLLEFIFDVWLDILTALRQPRQAKTP